MLTYKNTLYNFILIRANALLPHGQDILVLSQICKGLSQLTINSTGLLESVPLKCILKYSTVCLIV